MTRFDMRLTRKFFPRAGNAVYRREDHLCTARQTGDDTPLVGKGES